MRTIPSESVADNARADRDRGEIKGKGHPRFNNADGAAFRASGLCHRRAGYSRGDQRDARSCNRDNLATTSRTPARGMQLVTRDALMNPQRPDAGISY